MLAGKSGVNLHGPLLGGEIAFDSDFEGDVD
jgi:hypothetical protein